MDYLRELQRRQSALLARLLTMESSREDSDETDATSQRLAAEQPLRQGKRNGREASSMAPGKKERAAVLLEGEEAMQAAHEIGEPLRAAGKRWEEETVGAASVSAAAETEPQAMVILSESTGESLLAKSGDAYGRFLGSSGDRRGRDGRGGAVPGRSEGRPAL